MLKYENLNNVMLKGQCDNIEYEFTLGFMNGYPRFNIWDTSETTDRKLFAAITFTPVNMIALLNSVIGNLRGNREQLVFNSINHKYADGKRTEELESRGHMLFAHDKDLSLLVTHNNKSITFKLDDKEKYLEASLDNKQWLVNRYIAIFNTMKTAVELNVINRSSEHTVEK
jgi:hypothetical protein